ncbi:hypothetical protein NC651_004059 [Populus alba x Populus x berolinensis]|nr:hypothetical protein NC651_004059 [Populus alba x Populus x berolinensis]
MPKEFPNYEVYHSTKHPSCVFSSVLNEQEPPCFYTSNVSSRVAWKLISQCFKLMSRPSGVTEPIMQDNRLFPERISPTEVHILPSIIYSKSTKTPQQASLHIIMISS